ncbi:MAG: hypothetical protein WA510_25180 [Acidobacteriaceae bacterium]
MKYMQKMQKRGVFTLFGAMLLAASPVMAQNLPTSPKSQDPISELPTPLPSTS